MMGCYSCWLTWTVVIFPLIYFGWKFLMRNQQFFKQKGIPHVPGSPFFGSGWKTIVHRYTLIEWLLDMMHDFRSHRFFGIYNITGPTFVIQDPKLINQIAVKDFDSFTNHGNFIATDYDELLKNSLSVLRDQKWKDMRSTLSPAFTGSKMRLMFDLIRDCADNFVSYCKENLNSENVIEISAKDVFSKITTNIIATTAFGLKVDSVREPENLVYFHASRSFDLKSKDAMFRAMIIAGMPRIAKLFGMSFSPRDTQEFFKKLVQDTIDHRRKTKETRPDLIQLLMQAQDGTLTHDAGHKDDHGGFAVIEESEVGKEKNTKTWSDVEIAAQCFLFFIAGFDTTAGLLTFASYELAVNEEIQEKIYKEIQEAKEKLMGKPISYEVLQKMEYFDAFISEVLRVHPPSPITDRLCNRDTVIENHEGKKFTIPEGMTVWVNVYGIHHSHKYFPNPEQFDPERFLGANKAKIIPNSFIPFGVGPRGCIASRFALMEAKIILYDILSEFKFAVCDKTLVPMRYSQAFMLNPKVDLIVQLQKR